jgi:carbon monoxide dehydrogenase subunit G
VATPVAGGGDTWPVTRQDGRVPSIVSTVEIERSQHDVFPYVTDPERFVEWQPGVVEGHVQGPPAVGARCTMTRKLGGTQRTSTSEITEFDPPQRWSIHGIDGPIRADVSVLVDSLDEGRRSRVTIELDFHGRGLGRLLAPLVRSQARDEVPSSCQRLKERLEQTS